VYHTEGAGADRREGSFHHNGKYVALNGLRCVRSRLPPTQGNTSNMVTSTHDPAGTAHVVMGTGWRWHAAVRHKCHMKWCSRGVQEDSRDAVQCVSCADQPTESSDGSVAEVHVAGATWQPRHECQKLLVCWPQADVYEGVLIVSSA
jgi:hypothetical protein